MGMFLGYCPPYSSNSFRPLWYPYKEKDLEGSFLPVFQARILMLIEVSKARCKGRKQVMGNSLFFYLFPKYILLSPKKCRIYLLLSPKKCNFVADLCPKKCGVKVVLCPKKCKYGKKSISRAVGLEAKERA